MDSRPTLLEVARVAGVSKTTASLALRDHPKIPLPTRLKVKAAAEQLHYRPDPALSRIAAHRWRSREHVSDSAVAFITCNHPRLKQELDPKTRRAATERGEQLGYRVEHFRVEDYPAPEQLGRVLYHRGIRGVIVGKVFNESFVQRFPWELFASIGADVGYFRPPVHVVMPDFLHATVHAWQEALRLGYRRVGAAFLREPEAVDRLDKVSAALFCQTQLPGAGERIPLEHFPLDDRREFRAWLSEQRPDVVIGFNDTVYGWLREARRRMPADIGYISLMLTHGSGDGRELSGLATDWQSIGRLALEQLDILLRTNQVGLPERPVTVEVPSIWRPGATLRQIGVTKPRRGTRVAAGLSAAS